MGMVKALVKTGMSLCAMSHAMSHTRHGMQVMGVVKGLVKTGMTICATVHSPTPATFRLFDSVMILLRGRVVYAGANGASYAPLASPAMPLLAVATLGPRRSRRR